MMSSDTGHRRDPHRHTEHQAKSDAEQCDHEQPVSPGGTCEALVEACQGAICCELQEALRGGSAVDPGGITEPRDDPGVGVTPRVKAEGEGALLSDVRPVGRSDIFRMFRKLSEKQGPSARI